MNPWEDQAIYEAIEKRFVKNLGISSITGAVLNKYHFQSPWLIPPSFIFDDKSGHVTQLF